MTDAEDRAHILAQLAEHQVHQRHQHVTELAEVYARITHLRAELKSTEQTYRSAYRRTITTGLLTGPQLRSLGLPPIDARRRSTSSQSARHGESEKPEQSAHLTSSL
ncbi:MAG: hypothetical protein KAH46_00890 [Mycobacterium sp.]|nr:hypothetical protein [Mycobacterium sp.]